MVDRSADRWVTATWVRCAMGTTPYFFDPGEGEKAFGVDEGVRDSGCSKMVYRDGVRIPRVPLSCGLANTGGVIAPATFARPTVDEEVGFYRLEIFGSFVVLFAGRPPV